MLDRCIITSGGQSRRSRGSPPTKQLSEPTRRAKIEPPRMNVCAATLTVKVQISKRFWSTALMRLRYRI